MFKYEKANPATIKNFDSVERVVEFTPSGVDSEKVAKILSLAVDGKVMSATASDGYVEVEGRAEFKLVYIDVDNVEQGVSYNADFTVRVEDEVSADDKADAYVTVSESDVKTGDGITLSAVIVVGVQTVSVGECEYLSGAEDCLITDNLIVFPELVGTKSVVIPVEESTTVGEVGKVLCLSADTIVKNAVPSENSVSAELLTVATVTYTEGDEIRTATFEIASTEEVEIEGVGDGDVITACASVKKSRIVLAGVTGANELRFEGDISLKIKAFRMTETSAVADVFSLTHETEVENSERSQRAVARTSFYAEKIDGSAYLDDGKRANRIVAIPSANVQIAKAVAEDDGLRVDGITLISVVYDGEDGLDSVRAEVPFLVVLSGDFSEDVTARGIVGGVNAKLRRDGEIAFDIVLYIAVEEYATVTSTFISAVELGENKEVNDSGLSMYIAKDGDTLWDVCKALTATPDKITEQNPTLVEPLAEGEKVLFFRSLAR